MARLILDNTALLSSDPGLPLLGFLPAATYSRPNYDNSALLDLFFTLTVGFSVTAGGPPVVGDPILEVYTVNEDPGALPTAGLEVFPRYLAGVVSSSNATGAADFHTFSQIPLGPKTQKVTLLNVSPYTLTISTFAIQAYSLKTV